MRAVLLVAIMLAGACGPGGNGDCVDDNDCGGDLVCARNAECLPAGEIRSIRIAWTINGQPPNSALCASSPDLYVMFAGVQPGDTFGFAPVPCEAGLFVMDKLSKRFVSVELGAEGRFMMEKTIDSQGNVAFDLRP